MRLRAYGSYEELIKDVEESKARRDENPTLYNEIDYNLAVTNFSTFYLDNRPHQNLNDFEYERDYLKRKRALLEVCPDSQDTFIHKISTTNDIQLLAQSYPLSHFKHSFPYYNKEGFTSTNPVLRNNLLGRIMFDDWVNMKPDELYKQFHYACLISALYLKDPFSAFFYSCCQTEAKQHINQDISFADLVRNSELILKTNDKLKDHKMSPSEFREKLIELKKR